MQGAQRVAPWAAEPDLGRLCQSGQRGAPGLDLIRVEVAHRAQQEHPRSRRRDRQGQIDLGHIEAEVDALEAAAGGQERACEQPELVTVSSGGRHEYAPDAVERRATACHRGDEVSELSRHDVLVGDGEFASLPAVADLPEQGDDHFEEQRS